MPSYKTNYISLSTNWPDLQFVTQCPYQYKTTQASLYTLPVTLFSLFSPSWNLTKGVRLIEFILVWGYRLFNFRNRYLDLDFLVS
jgi:hypothetical protein